MAMVRFLFSIGPILFGIGFIAPVLAQSAQALAINTVFGIHIMVVCLILGGTLGILAKLRGRWL